MIRIVCALALFWIVGCDVPGTGPDPGPDKSVVAVANQGNFSDANGSLTVYDPDSGDSRAISNFGSIVQSLAYSQGRIYVMSNTGDRIDVLEIPSYTRIAQIPDITSPRYMLISGDKAYVTSLYGEAGSFTGGKVNVIDLTSNTKLKEIPVGDNPEGLALLGSRLFVANHGFGSGHTVNVIDTHTEAVVDTIDVECDGPRFVEADPEGDVFVFCTGQTLYDDQFNVVGETDGAVRVLNGSTGAVIEAIAVNGRIGTAGPGQDVYYAPGADVMMAVKDESTVLIFNTRQNSMTGQLGPFGGDPIGAIAHDQSAGIIYLGRNAGFTEAGKVTIHLPDGSQIGEFQAGVAPAYIEVIQ